MTDLKERMLQAHGGAQRWGELARVMLSVSVGGLDFLSRFQLNPLRDVEVTLAGDGPELTFSPYPRAGLSGGFSPHRVWLEDAAGQCVSERVLSAPIGQGLRRSLVWDELDVLAYAGLLLSEILQLPRLIATVEAELEELPPLGFAGERWQRLRLRYAESAPLSVSEHLLYLYGAGMIRRIDYASALYGAWFRVSQLWDGHESVAGLVFPTRCSIHPCIAPGIPMRATALTWLEFSD